MKSDINELRQVIASHSLAEAITIFCPKAQLFNLTNSQSEYTCVFTLHDKISEELLPHIESRINDHLESGKVSVMHMLVQNAKSYLKRLQKKKIAKVLDDWSDGVVSILQIENYAEVLIEDDFDIALKEPFKVKLTSLKSLDKTTYEISGTASSDEASLNEHIERLRIEEISGHVQTGEALSLFSQETDGIFWSRKGLNTLSHLEDYQASCFMIPQEAKTRIDAPGDIHLKEECYFTEDEYQENKNKNLFTLTRNTVLTIYLKDLKQLVSGIEKMVLGFNAEWDEKSLKRQKTTSIIVSSFLGTKVEIAKVFFEKETGVTKCYIVFSSLEKCLALHLEKKIDSEKVSAQSFFAKFLENSPLSGKKEYQENTHLG
ncbi:MAG: hypothetical protein S4CHLAM37_06470 [Chlamydiia bacterium]|nr:hypothetical protein [Chlamydiia bacterium]